MGCSAGWLALHYGSRVIIEPSERSWWGAGILQAQEADLWLGSNEMLQVWYAKRKTTVHLPAADPQVLTPSLTRIQLWFGDRGQTNISKDPLFRTRASFGNMSEERRKEEGACEVLGNDCWSAGVQPPSGTRLSIDSTKYKQVDFLYIVSMF